MLYKTKIGDSPAKIARRYGVPFGKLIGANPQKPTTVVAGVRTWQSLSPNESVNVPVGVGVGDAISDMVGINPCDQRNVNLVCAAQAVLGVTVDGKWGHGTATAAQALVPGAPGGCSPTPAWWGARGTSKCGSAPSGGGGGVPTSSLSVAAAAALAALTADPNYCASVARVGTLVNTTVHNFKAAWNASNPSSPVPIGTGKYEPVVAQALSSALGGQTVPPGCGAGAAPPPPMPLPTPAPTPIVIPTPIGPISPIPVVNPPTPAPPIVAPSAVPAAVQALLMTNPCDPSNVAAVCAAQRALGVSADGKWGPDSSRATGGLVPPCTPRPSWWTPKGQSNCPGAAAPPPPPPPPGPIPPPGPGGVTPMPGPAPSGGGGAQIVAPEKKKLSTGAIVAGAVGAAALIGLIAVAATGKKTHRGGAKRRGARKAHRKPAHRRARRKK